MMACTSPKWSHGEISSNIITDRSLTLELYLISKSLDKHDENQRRHNHETAFLIPFIMTLDIFEHQELMFVQALLTGTK